MSTGSDCSPVDEVSKASKVSPIGTSRHFAALQQFGRFLSEADINSEGSQHWICEYMPRRPSTPRQPNTRTIGALVTLQRNGERRLRQRSGANGAKQTAVGALDVDTSTSSELDAPTLSELDAPATCAGGPRRWG
jgi:hypothetical protein